MGPKKICIYVSSALIMVLSGLISVIGASWKAYGDPVSGKIIELRMEDKEALAILGKGVVGRALPAKPISDTAGLMPLNAGKWTYRVLAGSRKGKDQEDKIAKPKYRGSGNRWRRVVGKKFIEYYRVGKDGKIELASEVDLVKDVITTYTPLVPEIFNSMKPGEQKGVETDIKVYDLHDPTDEKYQGHLKVVHTYVGAYEITVPAGKYQTVLIKSSYVGKVGPATVKDVGYVFYAEGAGVVAAIERSHVVAFLFYDEKSRTSKVLVNKEIS